jgi:hypothetical protein
MTIATPKNIRSLSTSPYAYKNCLFQQSSNQFIPMMFHLCSIYQMKVPSDDSHSLLRSWFCYYTFISNWFVFFFAGFCHFHPIISYSRLTLPSSDSLFPKHAPSSATIKVPKKKKMTQSYYFASNIDLNATVTSVLDTVSSKIFSAVYGYHQRGAFTPTRKNIPYLHTADDM